MKKYLSYIITVIAWFVGYYVYLPPINIKSNEFWSFIVFALVVAIFLNAYRFVRQLNLGDLRGSISNATKGGKTFLYIFLAFLAVYFIGNVISQPVFRAQQYSGLLNVNQGVFKEDIEEADFKQIPILDSNSAAIIAEREMGTLSDIVSQFEVSSYFSQINYNGKPFRVTPLRYGSAIKWIANRSAGIPAYILIDMTTQDAECIRLNEGIKISPSEYFGRDLMRYVRFRYPTEMIRGTYFEIDDNGTPYWICSVMDHTIGLFGGTDIKGAIVINAITGENTYYDVADVPTWIDKVYDAELLMQQYDYYGTLSNGYINSVFAQKNCLRTTDGYNYIALDDDVWVYTGVTSVGADQSNVGFVLMNQRTKETNYYSISGAEEYSAMSSAEGQVQHLGYTATFPLLLNVGGEPTYFLALKDEAGLVKKYAMVNIQKYQIVAIGDTVNECLNEYTRLMLGNGITVKEVVVSQTVTGTITDIRDIVIDGNTYIYVSLSGKDELYSVKAGDILSILKKKIGDSVTFEYDTTLIGGVYTVTKVE
ncbi:MAG: CvpA family protein [Candidatus Metalachnospira sp.]|nr:CvpA family protein [Candidatus Metalachnospira sp.]